ncbi:DNA-3-methyladenine glycosylase [Microbacterium sp. P01]|uniref:DNA-3-methyladenine glycosylase n=1 Tax=unclassified Microbacterium TaxID=2609290 RepID=UPI00366DC4B7
MTTSSPPRVRPATRRDLEGLAADVAPSLLGAHLTVTSATDAEEHAETVTIRLTEVEAYHGLGTGPTADPGSHARMGPTPRNATMWGDPGHLYVYLSHGIHSCVNIVCGPAGVAGGVLLRGAEVIEGADAATRRRPAAIRPRDLARGPGRLGTAIGLKHPLHDGIDAITGESWQGASARLELLSEPLTRFASGPRVGVAGAAGTAKFPWRFWVPDDPTVSAFRWGRGAASA